jgi:hypothetical protein
VVRENRAPERAGIWFRRTAAGEAGISLEILESLVERHADARTSCGIVIDDAHGGVGASVRRNTIRGNGIGLVMKNGRGSVMDNAFETNTLADTLTSGNDRVPEYFDNQLSGNNTGERGFSVFIPPSQAAALSIAHNNIEGHTKFGLASSVDIHPWDDWWGNAGGPTHSGGPALGDRITGNVNPRPFATARLALTPPAAPQLAMPGGAAPATPATPDCQGGRGLGTPGIPEEPPPGRTPLGSRLLDAGLRARLVLASAAEVRAVLVPGGEAVVLDSADGVAGVLSSGGVWREAPRATPSEEPGEYVTFPWNPSPRDRRPDALSSAFGEIHAMRMDPSGSYARRCDVRIDYVISGLRVPAAVARNAWRAGETAELVAVVDGWPLLRFAPTSGEPVVPERARFAVTWSDDGYTAALDWDAHGIHGWRTGLCLPLPANWFNAPGTIETLHAPETGRLEEVLWPAEADRLAPAAGVRVTEMEVGRHRPAAVIGNIGAGTWSLRVATELPGN